MSQDLSGSVIEARRQAAEMASHATRLDVETVEWLEGMVASGEMALAPSDVRLAGREGRYGWADTLGRLGWRGTEVSIHLERATLASAPKAKVRWSERLGLYMVYHEDGTRMTLDEVAASVKARLARIEAAIAAPAA